MSFEITTSTVGRPTISAGRYTLHLFPREAKNQFWGFDEWADLGMVFHDFGIGRFALVCWWEDWCGMSEDPDSRA